MGEGSRSSLRYDTRTLVSWVCDVIAIGHETKQFAWVGVSAPEMLDQNGQTPTNLQQLSNKVLTSISKG